MHIIKHFKTITKHRHMVMRYCRLAGIGFQGLFHDLSKYSPAEFIPGAKYYQGNRSPNEKEREVLGYSKAWLHHKGRNKHHFEYWRDVNQAVHRYEPVEMPLNYAAEMFCDRVAASRIYKGKDYKDSDPYTYYSMHSTRDKMHEKTADQLEVWLKMLAEKGEKEAFGAIRRQLKEWKKSEKQKKQENSP